MDIGTLFLMIAFALGLGVLFYDLLPGQLPMQIWRVWAYPFIAIVVTQALFDAGVVTLGPVFGGVHVFPAIIAALVGVLIDWIITIARRPQAVASLERPVTVSPTTTTTAMPRP